MQDTEHKTDVEQLTIAQFGFLDSEGITIPRDKMRVSGRFSIEGVPAGEVEKIVRRFWLENNEGRYFVEKDGEITTFSYEPRGYDPYVGPIIGKDGRVINPGDKGHPATRT
jgi:hypothetical protein